MGKTSDLAKADSAIAAPWGKAGTTITTTRDLTVAEMGHVLIDATAAAVVATLPAATAYHDVLLRRVDLTANAVTITAAGADKIMLEASAGQATAELLDFGDFIHLRSDAAGKWWRIAAAQIATETYRGTAKVATQVLTDAGVDDKTIITPKKLRFGFSASFGADGYFTFPSWLGSLCLQWGVISTAANGVGTATFQVPLSQKFFQLGTTLGADTAENSFHWNVEIYTTLLAISAYTYRTEFTGATTKSARGVSWLVAGKA